MTETKNAKQPICAVIETGGKQYLVKTGDCLRVEKLSDAEGGTITFDKILLFSDGKKLKIGAPYLEGTQVSAEHLAYGRAKKISIMRFHSKTRYRKKKGHRQHYSMVKILPIT